MPIVEDTQIMCDLSPCGSAAFAHMMFGGNGKGSQSLNICGKCLGDFRERSSAAIQQNIVWIALSAPRKPEANDT